LICFPFCIVVFVAFFKNKNKKSIALFFVALLS
jgi:hypothetical protein